MTTQVSGDLRVITSTPAKITSVDVRSTTTRPSGDGLMLGQWVTLSKPGQFNAASGEVDFPAVPGPAQLKLFSGGSTVGSVALIVPDSPSASLADCVRLVGLVDDATRSELEKLAVEVVRDRERTETAVKRAVDAEAASAKSAKSALDSAAEAASSEDAAAKSETASAASSELSKDAAAVSVAAALGFEGHTPAQVIDAATRAESARDTAVDAAETSTADRTYVAEVRDELEDAYAESEAGQAVPPRLTEAGLNRTYIIRGEYAVSVRSYGATGDGVTDDSDAVQAALDANGGGVVSFPPGRYRLTRDFDVPGGTTLFGAGSTSTVLDFSTKDTWTSGTESAFFVWERGSFYDLTAVTEDVAAGDPSITVAAGHSFVAGDIIRLTSDEVRWGEAVKAEFQRVVQVDGNVLYLSGSTFDSYNVVSDARIEKVNFVGAQMAGFTFVGKGLNPASVTNDAIDANRGDNALNFTLARNVSLSDLNFVDVENRVIRMSSVLGAVVDNCHWEFDPARVRLQYGLSLNGATQLVSMTNCSSLNDRHMITTSTSGSLSEGYSPMRGIPRLITVTGCTAHGSWQDPIDTHRGGEHISIVGNSLTTEAVGVKVRGVRVTVVGNTMVGKRSSPYATGLSGVRVVTRCEDTLISGNTFTGFDRAVSIEMPEGPSKEIAVIGNMILDCTYGVVVASDDGYIDGVSIKGNTIRTTGEGNPVHIASSVRNLVISDNELIGGREGIRATNAAGQVVEGAAVQDNTMRGQSLRAIFLRNFSDATVSGNHCPGGQLRIAGDFARVLITGNHLNLSDLTSTSVDVSKHMNGPDYT